MDAFTANNHIDFISTSTGRHSIIRDLDGVIVAPRIASRVGDIHPGAGQMLRENLPDAQVRVEQSEAFGGVTKAGCNGTIVCNGDRIGSIGISGDPERTEPLARVASSLISKEIREREMLDARRSVNLLMLLAPARLP